MVCVDHNTTEIYWSGCDVMFAFTCQFTDVLKEYIPYLRNNKSRTSETSLFLRNSRGRNPDGNILIVEIAAVDIASRDAYVY